MKILFWQWGAFMQKGMEKALNKMNIDYDVFFYQVKDWENDTEFVKLFGGKLGQTKYDKVLSVNYSPLISNVCNEMGVEYIAWVYDSPIHIRDISSLANPCNRVYFFDRGQAEKYNKMGFDRAFHMPLAADESVWTYNDKKMQEFSCDVALVGKLYKSDYNYLMGPLDEYSRGLLNGFVSSQEAIYGAYLLEELITDDLMKQLNVQYAKASGGKFKVLREELEYACACEVTGRERFKALALLSSRHKTHIHSNDNDSRLANAHQKGYVDYYTEMPSVFRAAKINLNISLKTIRTGIPLRVLDVMSCGGFLITNYQEELLEYFEPGEELVIYEDIKDLVFKVDYYLKHDDERMRIAENGRKKVAMLFGFEDKLRRMFLDDVK